MGRSGPDPPPGNLHRSGDHLPAEQLDALQESGYGIFAGPVVAHATIRFSEHAARWIADEQWHPKQRQRLLPDGSIELTVPYSNPRELLMDVARYGADAEIVVPVALREEMRGMLVAALGRYGFRQVSTATQGGGADAPCPGLSALAPSGLRCTAVSIAVCLPVKPRHF